jgi:hypothetical protein
MKRYPYEKDASNRKRLLADRYEFLLYKHLRHRAVPEYQLDPASGPVAKTHHMPAQGFEPQPILHQPKEPLKAEWR